MSRPVNAKLSVYLVRHNAMKICEKNGGIIPRIVNFGGRWSE
jgi:hypothetical protein